MDKVDELIGLWNNTLKGNEQAFNALHKILYPGLYCYTMKMIKDPDLADDLLQDLFIKFWQNKLRIGALINVRAYFYRSTRSIVLNYIRSRQLKESRLDAMPEPDLEFSREELIMSQEFNVERSHLVLEAINTLPPKQREIIHMRFYQDLAYVQIAEITGIRYQSVINHIYRAVQVLREATQLSNIHMV